MITFIEKEPFDASTWTGTVVRVPVYMVKDGIEYFVLNRRGDIPDDDRSL